VSSSRTQRPRGFSYLGLLIAVALMGIALAAVGEVWSTTAQRERERELLFVGGQFRQAIGRYYEASPGVKQYPRKLDDLLEDKRFPVVKRHLRQIYLDPMTGKPDWGLLTQGDQILGVYSLSKDTPLKIANFQLADAFLADSTSYSQWRFVYAPLGAAGAGAAALAAGTQLSRDSNPNSVSPGPTLGGSDAVSPANPALNAEIPRDPWICTAQRATDLRDCQSRPSSKGQQDCEQAVTQRYKACLSAAGGGTQRFGNQ
jgi:type II secretory pathway pseudopilin PulG